MAEAQKIKVKKASYQNYLFDPQNPTTYWKPALVTPVVVGQKKFAENAAAETGQDPYMLGGVLGRIFRTAGDYMTLGNAVQLHEDFGTLKPYIKVRSTKDKDKCNRSCIVGFGIKFIPTGKMKSLLENVQFEFAGESDGSDVDDSEVVDTPEQNPAPAQPGGEQTPTTYTLTLKKADGTVISTLQLAAGAAITYPAATSGYQWPASKPATMPAQNTTVQEQTAGGGGTNPGEDGVF